jgi:hypothetical protein
MATKKISGKSLAADVRSGMDCLALSEKHELSVTQLKKAISALVTKGILSETELPQWTSQEKPWKCPKCGRSQSERFERCPVCGVIIAKLLKISSAKDPISSSSSSTAPTPEFGSWRSEQPKNLVPGIIKVGAICLVALLVIVLGVKFVNRSSTPTPISATPQVETSESSPAISEVEPSKDTARVARERHPSEEAILKNRKARRIAKLAHDYRKTHTYSLDDRFACVDMSIDLWNQIQTAGIRAALMAGNVQTDITGFRAENMVQYVALMDHAWVVAEIELGRWLPVESTAGTIVSPLHPNYSRYFTGEFFTNPREFKSFEELRRHLFKNCLEAHQMADSFRKLVKAKPEGKQQVMEAYRARGQFEQRAGDCKEHFERIQQILNNRAEMVVPWVTQWDQ